MAIPILLDTDIGTDIDDAYALVLAASRPEIDLLAVATVNHDTPLRAAIARAVLSAMGRSEVPTLAGVGPSLTPGETRGWLGIEGRGIDLQELPAAPTDAAEEVAAFYRRAIECAMASNRKLTIVTIGAMTNLACVLARLDAGARAGVERIVAMASDFRGFGEENASTEHNVACDSVAMASVLESGIPLVLVGLNVTCRTAMDGGFVDRLSAVGGPLAAGLVGMHRVWFEWLGRESSPMHDGLAVAHLFMPGVVTLTPVTARVITDGPRAGAIVFGEADACATVRVATDLDAGAFAEMLEDAVLAVASQS